MKTGLVLEGGAMRGMYTAGVLDTFLEGGIRVDAVVGVSAGALFGVNYLSGQKGRVIRYNKRFNADKAYMGLRPLLREGNLFSTHYAYERVPRELDPFDDETFQASGVPFYAVVTDTATGEPEYMRIQSAFAQMDTLRASGSMPFVSRPVKIGDREYLDGGIGDSIPFQWMHSQGYDKLVVVLTQDKTYRKGPMPRLPLKLLQRSYPQIARQLLHRHETYNQALDLLAQWEKEGKAYVLRPSEPIHIHRTERDPQKLQQVYDLGVKDCRKHLPQLRQYLNL